MVSFSSLNLFLIAILKLDLLNSTSGTSESQSPFTTFFLSMGHALLHICISCNFFVREN